MMQRREFITLLGGAAAWPLAARAQQGERMRRIGVLMGFAEGDAGWQANVAALRAGLQELGWIDGRNVRIDYRWPAGIAINCAPIRQSSSRLLQPSFLHVPILR